MSHKHITQPNTFPEEEHSTFLQNNVTLGMHVQAYNLSAHEHIFSLGILYVYQDRLLPFGACAEHSCSKNV